MISKWSVVLFLAAWLIVKNAVSQVDSSTPERIKIFINCNDKEEGCFEDYITSELSFFDFVRDRFQADVQVFIITQETGSIGRKYSLSFIGQKKFTGIKDSSAFSVKLTSTEDDVRTRLLDEIKLGLAQFVVKTPWRSTLQVNYQSRPSEERVMTDDKWNSWVFLIGSEGNFDGESNRSSLVSESFISAVRVTPKSKFIADSWYSYTLNKFTIDSQRISVPVRNYGANIFYVHSLNSHWSTGVFLDIEHDQFRNIRMQHRTAAALEYNFYNFSENTKRQLRMSYQLGYRSLNYIDTTIFRILKEDRPYHQLALVANYAQPWGSINGTLRARSFLDKTTQNRITTRANISLRLFEGTNLTLQGSASIVNDQISLAKKEASEQEFLLRGAQLPTSFLYEMRIGFTFTFGSTNNSIVNPRFENVDD